MKTCTKCKKDLPSSLDFFYSVSTHKDGLSSRCRECIKAATKQWGKDHPEKKKQNEAAWRNKNKKEYDQRQRRNHLRRKFGLSEEQYQALLVKQKGVCFICSKPCQTGNHLAVDHNHETGEVRGLLCVVCNRGIGYLKDLPVNLLRAAAYILIYKERNS